jgi:hypothetical protein
MGLTPPLALVAPPLLEPPAEGKPPPVPASSPPEPTPGAPPAAAASPPPEPGVLVPPAPPAAETAPPSPEDAPDPTEPPELGPPPKEGKSGPGESASCLDEPSSSPLSRAQPEATIQTMKRRHLRSIGESLPPPGAEANYLFHRSKAKRRGRWFQGSQEQDLSESAPCLRAIKPRGSNDFSHRHRPFDAPKKL